MLSVPSRPPACPPVLVQHRLFLQVVHVVLVLALLLPKLLLQCHVLLGELLLLQPEFFQGAQLDPCPSGHKAGERLLLRASTHTPLRSQL